MQTPTLKVTQGADPFKRGSVNKKSIVVKIKATNLTLTWFMSSSELNIDIDIDFKFQGHTAVEGTTWGPRGGAVTSLVDRGR